MVEKLKLLPFVCLIIQVLLFLALVTKLLLGGIFQTSDLPFIRSVKRERLLFAFSLLFLILSYLILEKLDSEQGVYNYIFSALILLLTVTALILYHIQFRTSYKQINSTETINNKSEKQIFELKDISEEELKSLIKEKYHSSFSTNFLLFKNLFTDREKIDEKITCEKIAPRSKQIGYAPIFNLIDDLSKNGIKKLKNKERKKFKNFVIKNFKRGEEDMDEDNLDTAFTRWSKKN